MVLERFDSDITGRGNANSGDARTHGLVAVLAPHRREIPGSMPGRDIWHEKAQIALYLGSNCRFGDVHPSQWVARLRGQAKLAGEGRRVGCGLRFADFCIPAPRFGWLQNSLCALARFRLTFGRSTAGRVFAGLLTPAMLFAMFCSAPSGLCYFLHNGIIAAAQ